jgi:MFS family permease
LSAFLCRSAVAAAAAACSHVTFALQVTGQIIATLLSGALIDRLGRHNIISASLLIGGAACLGCSITANRTAQIVLATIGQFGCTGGQYVRVSRATLRCHSIWHLFHWRMLMQSTCTCTANATKHAYPSRLAKP